MSNAAKKNVVTDTKDPVIVTGNMKEISKLEIEEKTWNVEGMRYILEYEGGYYMPPESYITSKYLALVIQGKREILKLKDVKSLWVPPISPYLTTKMLWEQLCTKHQDIVKYMPQTESHHVPPRKYLYVGKKNLLTLVASTLYPEFPEYYTKLTDEARDGNR